MVPLRSSIPPTNPKLIRAKSKKKNMPLRDCERSHAAVIDVLILISVVVASGVLLYPYIELMGNKLFEFIGVVAYVVKDEILEDRSVFMYLGISMLFAIVAFLAMTISKSSKGCGRPGCLRLKKAVVLDIKLQTEEECLKKSNSIAKSAVKEGMFKLSKDQHQELEAELRKMAPPNGRAILVLRGKCGCSLGTMEVPGPKKSGKFRK